MICSQWCNEAGWRVATGVITEDLAMMRVQGFDRAPEGLSSAIFNPLKMPLT